MTRTDRALRCRWPRSALLLLSAILLATGLEAAESGPSTDPDHPAKGEWSEAIDRLNETLREISDSLRAIRLDQRALLLARRIEIAERRLEPLVVELRESRTESRRLKAEIERLNSYRESVQETVRQRVRDGADSSQVGEKEQLRQIDLALENMRANLERAESRVLEQESALDRARRGVAFLEDQLRDWMERSGP